MSEPTTVMTPIRALQIADGMIDPIDDAEGIAAWQCLLDSGQIETLPGRYGRHLAKMIFDGDIFLDSDSKDREMNA